MSAGNGLLNAFSIACWVRGLSGLPNRAGSASELDVRLSAVLGRILGNRLMATAKGSGGEGQQALPGVNLVG